MSIMAGGGSATFKPLLTSASSTAPYPPPHSAPQQPKALGHLDLSNSVRVNPGPSPLKQAVEVLPTVPVRSLPPNSPRSLFPPHAPSPVPQHSTAQHTLSSPVPGSIAPALIASNFYSSPSHQASQHSPAPQPQPPALNQVAASFYSSPTKAATSPAPPPPPPPPTYPSDPYNTTRPYAPTLTPYSQPPQPLTHPSSGVATQGASNGAGGHLSPARAASSYAKASSLIADVSPSASRNHQALQPQALQPQGGGGGGGSTSSKPMPLSHPSPLPPTLSPDHSSKAIPQPRPTLQDNTELWEIRRSGAQPLPSSSTDLAPFHPAMHPSARVTATVIVTPNPYSSK